MIAPRKAVRFRERSELLDFLLEVSTVTSQTLDLDELLANVSEIVKRVIPGELFAILLYSEKRRELRIRYAVGHREEVVQNWSIPLGEGITGTAALTREPVLASDVRSDPRYLNAVEAVRTELAVPMIARRKLVGVIDVQSTRPNAYTEQDRALLRLIAARVAISIDNARLYWRVERQNRTLKALASISQEFSSILDVNELLSKIASTVRGLINYDAFNILLVDAERKLLRHRFSIRYDQRVDLDNIPLGKGITGAAVEQRAPVRVDDTMQDPRYIASHPGIRSEVAIPLMTLDRVSGVMDLESERVGFFTDEHVRMLNLLAPQIASLRRERPAVRRAGHPRAAHGGRHAGRARAAESSAAHRRSGPGRPGSGRRTAPRARHQRRHLRFLRIAGSSRGAGLRRRQRQGRGGGALRRAGQRIVAHCSPRGVPIPAS